MWISFNKKYSYRITACQQEKWPEKCDFDQGRNELQRLLVLNIKRSVNF